MLEKLLAFDSTIPLIEILKYGFGPVKLSGISTSSQLGP